GGEGVPREVLVEGDVGMNRCGVEPGRPALALARHVGAQRGLRFVGLQGYDGHLQMLPDAAERRAKCWEGLDKLLETRRLLELDSAGLPLEGVTGGGTGAGEVVGEHEGPTGGPAGAVLLVGAGVP